MKTPTQDQADIERAISKWPVLVQQLQQLVEQQFRQYDELLDKYDTLLTGSEGLSDGWSLLEKNRQEFEAHCQKVSDEIEREYQQLSEGWERLENQQRQLESAMLADQLPHRSDKFPQLTQIQADSASTAGQGVVSEQGEKESTPSTTAVNLPPERPQPQNLDIRDNWSPHMSGTTALQFEQMKRQIQRHSSEHRRK